MSLSNSSCTFLAAIALSKSVFALLTAGWSIFKSPWTVLAASNAVLSASSSGSPASNGWRASAVVIDWFNAALSALGTNAFLASFIAFDAAFKVSGVAFVSAACVLPSVRDESNGVTELGV